MKTESINKGKGVKKDSSSIASPYFVLILSIMLTIGASLLFHQSAKNKDTVRFANSVNRVRFAMENRIGLYIALLKAGRGFVESSSELNRAKYANFIDSLEIEKNYHGAQGIGFTLTVRKAEREKFLAQVKAEGIENYKIFPEGEREIYQPVLYIEPLTERNQRAIGFDMASEEIRRAAMEKARDTGVAAVTGKILPLQNNEGDRQFGFLIYMPIYKHGTNPTSVEQRQNDIYGFIYSPFRANNFLKDVQENAGTTDIVITIYDGEPGSKTFLAQTESENKRSFTQPLTTDYSSQNEFDFAGHRWIVQYDSLPSFAAQSSTNWTPLILMCGFIFSLLLFGMTYWEAATRAKLQKTADDLSESEKQIQGLLEKEQTARRIAEDANTTKDEFISVVSHELRTPLNAIAGWARILQSEDLSGNTRELALEKIEKNLRLQTVLVEDLLNYSQLVSNKAKIDKVPCECEKIIEAIFPKYEKIAAEKGIILEMENNSSGQKVLCDFEKLKIVFENLLSNALKFTPRNGNVKVLLAKREQFVEVKIIDSGRGIMPEFLPRIFDRFSQFDSSTTRSFGGLGLGLAVSEHIIKLHQGTICAESAGENKGSTFSVKLPIYTPE